MFAHLIKEDYNNHIIYDCPVSIQLCNLLTVKEIFNKLWKKHISKVTSQYTDLKLHFILNQRIHISLRKYYTYLKTNFKQCVKFASEPVSYKTC